MVDTCPKNSSFDDNAHACACKPGNVPYGGACRSLEEANTACGVGNQYDRGHCVAKTCAPSEVLNATTGECDRKADVEQAVAASSGMSLRPGQTLACAAGYTFIVNGSDGACIPNELLCAPGTKYEGGACVPQATCPAGEVIGLAGSCTKLASGSDTAKFSVALKLKSELGPSFCTPLSKNPAAFGVTPGGSITVKVQVSLTVPGNVIDRTSVDSVRVVTSAGTAMSDSSAGVAAVKRQVETQLLTNIRAIGGDSLESSASAEVSCKISRAAVQVVEGHGGGI